MIAEARKLLALAWPVITAQLGVMSMGVVDTLMVSRLGKASLDAAALGNVWMFGTLIIGMGVVFGMDPIVSQAHGAGDETRLHKTLHTGLVTALLVSIPVGAAWLLTEPALLLARQEVDLAEVAHRYTMVQIPSAPAFLLFIALRHHLQGREIVRPAMWVVLGANVVNVGLNWVLIFGNLGAPAFGVVGAGMATGVVRAFLLLALLGWTLAFELQPREWFRHRAGLWKSSDLKEVFRFGVPVGAMYGLEVWGFQVAILLAGFLGRSALAAHAIVINVISLTFMVPLGIAVGAVTRVGNLIGAGKPQDAQRAAWVSLGLGAAVMTGSATGLILLQRHVPAWYKADAETTALCIAIIPIAAAFQLFDGTQVVGGGILRGMGRTIPAAVFNLLGYYVLAIPIGAWLAFNRNMGLPGIWWGLFVGLAIIASCLVAWVHFAGPARR